MDDSDSADSAAPPGARTVLEPDAVRETDEGLAVDCPKCGATVTLVHVVEEGRCPGVVPADEAEVEGDDERLRDEGCGAALSLELVWEE